MTPAPSHLDLLAHARAVRHAAVVGDAAPLRRELVRLQAELLQHLQAEDEQLSTLPIGAATVAHEGQRRILTLLDDLLSSTGDLADIATWRPKAAEVELALRRQVKLEAALLQRHSLRGPSGPTGNDDFRPVSSADDGN